MRWIFSINFLWTKFIFRKQNQESLFLAVRDGMQIWCARDRGKFQIVDPKAEQVSWTRFASCAGMEAPHNN